MSLVLLACMDFALGDTFVVALCVVTLLMLWNVVGFACVHVGQRRSRSGRVREQLASLRE